MSLLYHEYSDFPIFRPLILLKINKVNKYLKLYYIPIYNTFKYRKGRAIMNKTISITTEQEDLLQKVSEAYGSNSFEVTELTFLLIMVNALASTLTYTDFDYVSRLRGLIEIVNNKIPDLKASKIKTAYPETCNILDILERRQNYQDIL
jgi:hypothetical protein